MSLPTPCDTRAVPSVEAIAEHYDSLDFFYRDIWGEHIHHGLWLRGDEIPDEAAVQMSRCALNCLRLKPGMAMADIGCGYGATARLAAERHGVDVVGFTVSKAQKRHAETLFVSRGSVRVRVRDWMKAHVPTASFDAILSLESIEHMPNRPDFLAEVRRALRPGGRFVINTWLASENPSPRFRRHLLDPISEEGRQATLINSGEMLTLLRASGFSNVQVEDLTRQVRKTWSVVIRRLLLHTLVGPRYWRFLWNSRAGDRVFALTACRIWAAYRVGAMKYGAFICE